MLFILFFYACTAVPLHPTARFDSLGNVVSVSPLPSASTGHVGCCVTCSLCHQEVWCQSSPAVCIARVLLLPWHLFPHASWTLHFMNCIYKYLTWILLALVAPFSWGYVPAFVGEYVPFFSPRGFWGFRIRQIHLKSVPAHNRPKQGLRLVIIIIVFCPGKLIGCPVYFSTIWAVFTLVYFAFLVVAS